MGIKNNKFKMPIILIITIVIILLFVCIIYKCVNLSKNKTTYIEINYNELIEKTEAGKRFALFIGSEDCPHCQKYKTTLNKVISDYNITVYYIDISKLDEKEFAYLNSHYPFTGTPVTIIIENGNEYKRQICRIDGAKNYTYVVKKLKKAEITKE